MEKSRLPPDCLGYKICLYSDGTDDWLLYFRFSAEGFSGENSSGYPVVHGSEGLDEMCRFWEGGLRFLGSQWECKRFDVNVRYTMQLSKFETRIGSLNGYKRI